MKLNTSSANCEMAKHCGASSHTSGLPSLTFRTLPAALIIEEFYIYFVDALNSQDFQCLLASQLPQFKFATHFVTETVNYEHNVNFNSPLI